MQFFYPLYSVIYSVYYVNTELFSLIDHWANSGRRLGPFTLWLHVLCDSQSYTRVRLCVPSLRSWVWHHSADQILAPFQISVDGWVEQLLKLGYGKEKHFKESVIVIDSLQNMASGQTNMVGSADRVSYSKQRWPRAKMGKEADPWSHRPQRFSVNAPCMGSGATFIHLSWPVSHTRTKSNRRWCFCHCTSVTYQNVGIVLKEGDV